MSKTNETKSATTRPLWKVGYTWVTGLGALRNGALVTEAETIEEANKKAEEILSAGNFRHYRLTNTKSY